MDLETNQNTDQQIDPAMYLNSISSDVTNPAGQVMLKNSGTNNRKWPVIMLIVLLIVLIVVWLVFVGINKFGAGGVENANTRSAEINSQEVNDDIVTLACSKDLDKAELDSYVSLPQSGSRSYFAVYSGNELESITQHTELAFDTSELAEMAGDKEINQYDEYYTNALNLSNDPFESDFYYSEDGNMLNINFVIERDEMDLDTTGRFIFPEGSVSIDDMQAFYERNGFTCKKINYEY